MRNRILLLGCLALVGCDKKPRGSENQSLPCRATPVYLWISAKQMSDQISVTTGATNGYDGQQESVILCKQDIFCNDHTGAFCGDTVAAGCETLTNSGVSTDGVVVQFNPATVSISLAQSKGYAIGRIEVDSSCHG